MNFCYCIGGTGARVADVAAHLCAMNMVDDQEITFIVVDKDKDCGGTRHATDTIDIVKNLADTGSANNPSALRRSKVIDATGAKVFCKTTLVRDDTWDFSDAFAKLSSVQGANGIGSLKETLSQQNSDDGVLFDAFYNTEEQDQDTQGGFYGRPSIGALIFKQMVKKGKWDDPNKITKDDIARPVKKFLSEKPGETARVFIIGSVFGGTGASIFSNLASHIRTTVQENDRARVLISGVLLLPYFAVPSGDANARIKTDEFYEKSRVALEQYAADPNLLRTENNPNGSFDTLYFCGQHPLHVTGERYAEHGGNQENHFDLVDLLAANAMTEFFKKEENDIAKSGAVYEYRFDSTGDAVQVTTAQIPKDLRHHMTAMLTFSAFVISRVYGSFKIHDDKNEPWEAEMFKSLFKKGDLKKKVRGGPTQYYSEQVKPVAEAFLKEIYDYCVRYVDFINDIAKNGQNWTGSSTNSYEKNYSLFNPEYTEELRTIADYMKNNDTDEAHRRIGSFLNGTIGRQYFPKTDGITMRVIMDSLRDTFDGCAGNYNENTIQERFGDYIHEAFKYCLQMC